MTLSNKKKSLRMEINREERIQALGKKAAGLELPLRGGGDFHRACTYANVGGNPSVPATL